MCRFLFARNSQINHKILGFERSLCLVCCILQYFPEYLIIFTFFIEPKLSLKKEPIKKFVIFQKYSHIVQHVEASLHI